MELLIPICLTNLFTFGPAAFFGFVGWKAIERSEIHVLLGDVTDKVYHRETEPFDYWFYTLLACGGAAMFVLIGIWGNIHLLTSAAAGG